MTEADVIQPSASTASIGKGIRYIGQHCYAFSGQVGVDDNEKTLLEFHATGATFIIGKFYFMRMEDAASTDDYRYTVKFNDLIIYRTQTTSSFQVPLRVGVKLLIPPSTNVVVSSANITNNNANDIGSLLTGRVYGAT